MERLSERKIVLVTRKTRLDELISRFNTETQARFYLEHRGGDFSDYQREDRNYKNAVQVVSHMLAQMGRLQLVDRTYLANFIFGPEDIVVVLGQDGLVANVIKYLDGQPVIGVNPDPQRWEGVLLAFQVADLSRILPEVLNDRRNMRTVTMAQANLNDGQILRAVNDLFIGPKSHLSARYTLQIGNCCEEHSSSGIIVSTGLGSTGWLRSILAGATGIVSSLTEQATPPLPFDGLAWDTDFLYFSVREPWPSTTSSASITFGKITRDKPLRLISHMPEHGVIFSDGMEHDFIAFNAGTIATITLATQQGHLVV